MTDENSHLERQLWKAADKLRNNMDAAEYAEIMDTLTDMEDADVENV
jgi:type I restriction-modification system DNA methylase subunit